MLISELGLRQSSIPRTKATSSVMLFAARVVSCLGKSVSVEDENKVGIH